VLRFVITRVALVLPAFFGIILLTFMLVRLAPGDPVTVLVGEHNVTPQQRLELEHSLGLDRPVVIQFFDYVGKVLQGDFGRSINSRRPVIEEFGALFPNTLELSVCAMLFAVIIGLPAGIFAAVRRGTVFDHVLMGGSLVGYSMPIFWWGLLLIIGFSVNLHWTPVSGRIDFDYYVEPVTGFLLIDSALYGDAGAFLSALKHLILPSIVLGTIPLAVIARMTRSSMLEVLGEDYVRTARAKGLSELRVVSLHALRNALIPVVTVIGLQVGTLLGGAILTETIFSWPGVGRWLVGSVVKNDYPAVQGGVLLICTVVILVNLGVDLAYGVLNPRIRHRR